MERHEHHHPHDHKLAEDLNPQPEPPGRRAPAEEFNPQPDPPGKPIQ